ncbi:MAG TPA: hypothetical protein VKP03_00355, partial [Patescibacteria group bacterium]|nr:hypothetical protein [Patescibacteria group bacterium]
MSKITNRLIDNLLQGKTEQSSGDKLKINNVIGAAAIVYEKVRNAVDYQEEHLIRKNAIYRILRRKLLYEKVVFENYLLDKYHSDNMSKQLILELVRGGYIPKTVPEKMVDVVDEIVQKYEKLFSNIKETKGKVDKKTYRYFLELAAVELESALIPPKKEKAMANAMFSVYNPRLEFAAEDINKKQKELQVYIACYRALWKYDESMLRFLLLSLYYPEWKENDQELIIKLSNNVDKLIREFDKQINHPWQKLLQKILKKRAIVFWIIQDIVEANPDQAEEIFSDKERLENEIKKALTKRYKNVRVKLRRGVVRSIIYVFFTKMILALAVEVPLDIYLAGYINKVSMAINILFPPLLMFLVAIMIRMPKKEN